MQTRVENADFENWGAAAGEAAKVLAAGEVVAVAQPGRVAVGARVAVMLQYPCGQCVLCAAGEYIHCEDVVDFAAFSGQDEAGRRWRSIC